MKSTNHTAILEFLLLGLTDDPVLQPLIFSLFLFMYLVPILGNLLIILAVSSDPHLHTPMYFFLSNLSFTDICISTTTIPKMLANIPAQDQSINYTGCLTQNGFVLVFGGLENCLLAVMAYDCYVAICHPLSTVHSLLHTLMVLRVSFCTALQIPHFFCERAQVIKLACSDTFINNLLIYSVSSLFVGIPLIGIILSYTQIVSSLLRIPSVGGRYKVFSTCGSHLSVVSLFYGTGFGVYMSSAVTDSSMKTAVASMLYIVVLQMLNSFIYSLKNRDMNGALRHLIMELSSPGSCPLLSF
ncbi:Olfactory receptor 7G1 [Sciurus carolinensis]|uniref:Olfactory receptor 7G1 n=1 Tax=Sciurus carolinensis TaxID=30640 RepID=A0AA41N6M1_SCICA|nr:Olfactory receptor 7G1 [Sciurus carolinensis]